MSSRAARAVAVLAAGAALAAAGCGSDDDSGDGGESASGGGDGGSAYGGGGGGGGEAGGGATTLKLSADPGGALAFDKTSLRAKPGKVTISMDNPSDVPHAVEVEGKGVEKEGKTVGKGGVSKVTVDLKRGEYEFYCPVGDHQDAGMEGTLTVG